VRHLLTTTIPALLLPNTVQQRLTHEIQAARSR
jgi:hypothetical protein